MTWAPDSWRSRPIQQQPRYADGEAVRRALAQVSQLPPLIHRGEIDNLRGQLAAAADGRAFLLQGGDCAERFVDCAPGPIEAKVKILLQMSLVLTWGARLPVIRVGRIAGQYAKPRSRDTEVVGGVEIPSYRGDHVNGHGATPEEREPDPNRLVQAYFRSASTLNYMRALVEGGFADLRQPDHWDLGFVRSTARRQEYHVMVDRILDALEFVQTTGVRDSEALRTVDLFASHEGLLLPYEQAHTSQVGERWYNFGAHMLWIGDRTRQLDGAHVEYFRGIANPIGIKVGPSLDADELVDLLDVLDPMREPGRITLITRFGADGVRAHLPPLLESVRRSGRRVVWSCDPMHGNTRVTDGGVKTRELHRIHAEIEHVHAVHAEFDSHLGGVHLELTGEDVTECMGGPQELKEVDLGRSYETFCDPRLNFAQSLEIAFRLAVMLSSARSRPLG